MTRHIRIRHLHEVHPRSRGEHTVRACKSAPTKGSSPLAQGISRLLGIGLWVVRLTPARAGNMPAGVFLVLRPSAHPRSRGEHDMVFTPPKSVSGSSPLARGTFSSRRLALDEVRLIPARAGNIGKCPGGRHDWPAHPRSRGEHDMVFTPPKSVSGSSPLARGTFSSRRLALDEVRLIPARAGNIGKCPGGRHDWPAHPRSRGEHRAVVARTTGMAGSSPLARGTLIHYEIDYTATRLIPARAGNIGD